MNATGNSVKNICVFCGSSAGEYPEYGETARDLGCTIADRGMTLVYGGGNPGLMGILSRSVLERGGCVIGVIPRFLAEKNLVQQGISELIVVETMSERKELMTGLSDAFITLPGGLGTLDEVFEVLSLAQLGLHAKPCAFYNVRNYYDFLGTFLDTAVSEGFVQSEFRDMIYMGCNAGDILSFIRNYTPPARRKRALEHA